MNPGVLCPTPRDPVCLRWEGGKEGPQGDPWQPPPQSASVYYRHDKLVQALQTEPGQRKKRGELKKRERGAARGTAGPSALPLASLCSWQKKTGERKEAARISALLLFALSFPKQAETSRHAKDWTWHKDGTSLGSLDHRANFSVDLRISSSDRLVQSEGHRSSCVKARAPPCRSRFP